MPLQPRRDGCAVIERAPGGQWGDNCTRPPTVRAVWQFDKPGPQRILLCDQHAAELAGRERLTLGASLTRDNGGDLGMGVNPTR